MSEVGGRARTFFYFYDCFFFVSFPSGTCFFYQNVMCFEPFWDQNVHQYFDVARWLIVVCFLLFSVLFCASLVSKEVFNTDNSNTFLYIVTIQ